MEPLYPNVGDALHVLHIRKSNRDQREATPRWYSEAVSLWESWFPFSERSPGVPPARERVPECVYITRPDHALHQLIGRLHRHLTLLAQRKTQMLNQTQVKRIRPFDGSHRGQSVLFATHERQHENGRSQVGGEFLRPELVTVGAEERKRRVGVISLREIGKRCQHLR